MKTLKRFITLSFCLSALCLFTINAQNISTTYSAEQIDELYKKHKMYKPRDTNPSPELNDTFLKDFPNARDIDWEKSDVLYEVEFEIGRLPSRDYEAYYDMQGKLIMYKQEISTKDIPAVVKNGALTKYPKSDIEEATKIVKGKELFYKIELEKGDLDVKITLNVEGIIINEIID